MTPEILAIDRERPDPALVAYIAYRLKRGDVIGMPTDTFYGLAVDPVNLRAVERVYEIKSRARHKPLTLLVASVDQAAALAGRLPNAFFRLAERFWPGPLTMIVNAGSAMPLKVTANTGNVAVRMPSAAIPRAIAQAMDFPITGTAASLPGGVECLTAEEVCDQLSGRIPIVVDGGMPRHSTFTSIVDLSGEPTDWNVQREGAISKAEIAEVLWA